MIKVPTAVFYLNPREYPPSMDVEEYLLKPNLSGLNSLVYQKKLYHCFEALFVGKDMSWFGDEVVPLITKYDKVTHREYLPE